jgi:hypothetical protein
VGLKGLSVTEGGDVRGHHVFAPWTSPFFRPYSKRFVEHTVSKPFIEQPKVGFYEANLLV